MNDDKKTINVKVIGVGGIGSLLVGPLSRYLNHQSKEKFVITLIDGDEYEEKNSCRQDFDEFENKAKETVRRLKPRFPQIRFKAVGKYLTEDNIISNIREDDVVFMCVDNHKTRNLVSQRCSQLNNVVLFNGANHDEETNPYEGDVIIYIREHGRDKTKSLTDLYPAIANPVDENPADLQGCEATHDSFPQLILTNNLVAATMLNCYHDFREDTLTATQVFLDAGKHRMRPTPDVQPQVEID